MDELAHTNVPGARNLKRYQDVLELQASRHRRHQHRSTSSIWPACTHTIQALAGVAVTETLLDWVLDAADEVKMVDQSPGGVAEAASARQRSASRPRSSRPWMASFNYDTLTAFRAVTLRRVADHNASAWRTAAQHGNFPGLARRRRSGLPAAPTTLAQLLVRRGVHLAERLQARLIVLHIAQAWRPERPS